MNKRTPQFSQLTHYTIIAIRTQKYVKGGPGLLSVYLYTNFEKSLVISRNLLLKWPELRHTEPTRAQPTINPRLYPTLKKNSYPTPPPGLGLELM